MGISWVLPMLECKYNLQDHAHRLHTRARPLCNLVSVGGRPPPAPLTPCFSWTCATPPRPGRRGPQSDRHHKPCECVRGRGRKRQLHGAVLKAGCAASRGCLQHLEHPLAARPQRLTRQGRRATHCCASSGVTSSVRVLRNWRNDMGPRLAGGGGSVRFVCVWAVCLCAGGGWAGAGGVSGPQAAFQARCGERQAPLCSWRHTIADRQAPGTSAATRPQGGRRPVGMRPTVTRRLTGAAAGAAGHRGRRRQSRGRRPRGKTPRAHHSGAAVGASGRCAVASARCGCVGWRGLG